MRIGLLHERAFDSRPFAFRNRHLLPLFFETVTVTFATLPRKPLFEVPVLHTRSMVRPLSCTRRREARRFRLLMLDRGVSRSPHTAFVEDSGVAPDVFGCPLQSAP